MIVTRMLRDTNDVVLMTSQMTGTFALGAVTTPFVWVTPIAFDLIFLLVIGAISIGAQFSINRSLKLAPASVVVPYQYSMLVWAILFGYVGVRRRAGRLHAARRARSSLRPASISSVASRSRRARPPSSRRRA